MNTDDGWKTKDFFLKKDGEKGIWGLHETGLEEENEWHRLESWINMYDDNFKFLGSAARIFGPIEEELEAWLEDGYKQVEKPNDEAGSEQGNSKAD